MMTIRILYVLIYKCAMFVFLYSFNRLCVPFFTYVWIELTCSNYSHASNTVRISAQKIPNGIPRFCKSLTRRFDPQRPIRSLKKITLDPNVIVSEVPEVPTWCLDGPTINLISQADSCQPEGPSGWQLFGGPSEANLRTRLKPSWIKHGANLRSTRANSKLTN